MPAAPVAAMFWLWISMPAAAAVEPPAFMWLYGELYDVSSIASWHPGGRGILNQAQNLVLPDATPLFESMHSLRDAEEMRKKLAPLLVSGTTNMGRTKQLYTFREEGFYRVLRKRVSAFLNEATGKPVAPKGGVAMVAKWVAAMLLVSALLAGGVRVQSPFVSGLLCGAAGFCLIMASFVILHDASHMAAFRRDVEMTDFVGRFTHPLIGWDFPIWRVHHVLLHHTYTGHRRMDPDLSHGLPVWCKMPSDYDCLDSAPWQFLNTLAGLHTGQFFTYLGMRFDSSGTGGTPAIAPGRSFKEYYLGSRLGNLRFILLEGWRWWQYVVGSWWVPFAAAMYKGTRSHGVSARSSILRSVVGLSLMNLGMNIGYSINIAIDHDSVVTHANLAAFEHSVEGNVAAGRAVADWGEVQLRGTANWAGPIWCFLFGGINYQIEHHLFPTVYHGYYPSIAPIVRKTAEEFGLPYQHFYGIGDGLSSVFAQYLNSARQKVVSPRAVQHQEMPVVVYLMKGITLWQIGCALVCLVGSLQPHMARIRGSERVVSDLMFVKVE